METNTLLNEMIRREATDLHLMAGQPPTFRCDGALVRGDSAPLDAADLHDFISPLLDDEQQARLQSSQDVDTSLRHEGRLFQFTIFHAEGHLAASVRIIPNHVPPLEDLRYGPEVSATLNAMIRKPKGLILITGETGSGKQTLCAAMLESVNRTGSARIWTLEDPIVYEFQSEHALISQRVIGHDVASYEAGLEAAMRADVDIVYISDLRSLEAARLAMTLAENGHTVLAVLGVGSVSEAIHRLCDVFGAQSETVRRLLAQTLIGVVAQRLLKRTGGGRVPILEILLNTPRVRQAIREGMNDLTLAIEAGRPQGMQTMDDALLAACHAGQISWEIAREQISDLYRLPPPS